VDKVVWVWYGSMELEAIMHSVVCRSTFYGVIWEMSVYAILA